MSRADAQALAMLSLARGAVVTIRDKQPGDREFAALIAAADRACDRACAFYKAGQADIIRAVGYMAAFKRRLVDAGIDADSWREMIAMGHMACNDLLDHIKNRKKKNLVENASKTLAAVDDWFSEQVTDLAPYRAADRILDILYDVFEHDEPQASLRRQIAAGLEERRVV